MAWSIYFCFGLICFSLAPLVTFIMADLNLTYTQIGFIAGAWPLAFLISSYPEGTIIDRIGTRKSLALGIVLISSSSILRALAYNFPSLLIFAAMFGFGAPMISLGLPKLVASWFSGRERGTASGIYFTGAYSGIAFSQGATNSLIIPLVGSWRYCFLLYGLVGLLVALVWIRFSRSPPRLDLRKLNGDQKTWEAMTKLLKYRDVWMVVIIGSTTFITVHSLTNWLPKILESQAFTATMAGFFAAAFSLCRVLGSLIIPRMSYSMGSRKLLVSIILIITALSTFLMGSAVETWLLLGIISGGICIGALSPILLTILMDMPEVGSRNMGAAGGLFFSFGEVGGILGPIMIGLLKDITGSFFLGLAILALIVGSMLVPIAFVRKM